MTHAAATLVRWLVDPARQEELLGDLEELSRRTRGRVWLDALSVCVRQSRLAAAARRPPRVAALLAVLAAVALGSTPPGGTLLTVHAVDPAGEFTLQFEGARVVRATLDGAPVPPQRLIQEDGRLVIQGAGDAGTDLTIRLASGGRFSWRPRSPRPATLP